MQLKLAIGNNVIAAVPLNKTMAGNKKCIKAICHLLNASHSAAIAAQKESPVYYLQIASKMNRPVPARNKRKATTLS